MEFAVYEKTTGRILWFVCCPCECVMDQIVDEDKEIFLNCPKDATHIIDGEPVKV